MLQKTKANLYINVHHGTRGSSTPSLILMKTFCLIWTWALLFLLCRSAPHVFWNDTMNNLDAWTHNGVFILTSDTCLKPNCAMLQTTEYMTHDATSTVGYADLYLQYWIYISVLNQDNSPLYVEYSISFNTWKLLKTHTGSYIFLNEVVPLPSECEGISNLKIKMRGDGSGSDQWYFDNVALFSQGMSPTSTPTTNQPTNNPTTAIPTTHKPTTKVPTTTTPTTNQPTNYPTTNAPTTNYPTTIIPTVIPTTNAPTTNVPTTKYPTTTPTTFMPTSNMPSTNEPTLYPTIDEQEAGVNEQSTLYPTIDKGRSENNSLDTMVLYIIVAILCGILMIGCILFYIYRSRQKSKLKLDLKVLKPVNVDSGMTGIELCNTSPMSIISSPDTNITKHEGEVQSTQYLDTINMKINENETNMVEDNILDASDDSEDNMYVTQHNVTVGGDNEPVTTTGGIAIGGDMNEMDGMDINQMNNESDDDMNEMYSDKLRNVTTGK